MRKMQIKKVLGIIAIFLFALFFAVSIGGCTMTNKAKNSTTQESNSKEDIVLMKTTMGDIKIKLYADMPVTAGNFKRLVSESFYNGVIFHRVIDNFMIQGGDPTGTGMGGPGYEIEDEFTNHNKNNRGTIAMANAGPNTGGSQFFINTVNNNYLDSKHPVFGEIIEGMDVVDAMSKVDVDESSKPLEDVKIVEATIEN
jgi:peptidylprolyl isomerase